MKHHYNFVFFSGYTEGAYTYGHSDKNGELVARYIDGLMAKENKLLRFLYRAHTSKRTNSLFKLPFKKIWNKFYFREKFDNGKPICFVFSCELYFLKDYGYFDYLRRKYPGCKLIFSFTDKVDLVSKRFKKFDLSFLKSRFDFITTYEIYDVEKYDLTYCINLQKSFPKDNKKNLISDVVFVGEAKDRLGIILQCYDFFVKKGLICDFTIAFAPFDIREKYPNINWVDSWIPYDEVLEKVYSSKCILDIVQDKALGINARARRAFQFDKKLISNCFGIQYCTFYDGVNVQYFERVEDIDINKIINNKMPTYQYNHIVENLQNTDYFEFLLNNKEAKHSFYLPFIDVDSMLNDLNNNKVQGESQCL